ncbi:type VII secretion protein EccE [Amycolatopsis cynarae]|uniref:Type VII secretion protein EccE n=1 Tax=Amycolatopsis cynarae TaxID=2995223 RepID=A0ABY7BAW5_9PSEU|nr:type VII secretion protein EccE [Amycolatopsis sp. HUAS 11-8]WAL67838.1 type VII secretion protein EccE [Amycolatopsis sp. HUAS 11-8]
MTDPGAGGARLTAPASPQPQTGMAGQPTATAYGSVSLPEPDARAAARAAAVAALAAARPAEQPWASGGLAAAGAQPRNAPANPAPAAPPPGRRRATGPLAGIGPLQIICWQLVLIAAVLAAGQSWPVIAATGLGAVVVLALTAVRVHGRWGYEWLLLSARYLRRRREDDLRDGPAQKLLRLIAPEAEGCTDTLDDEPVFMLSRAEGISAVLQPQSNDVPPPAALVPPPNEQPLAFAAQVIHHAGLGRQRPLRTWIVLQALRTVEVYSDIDVRLALGNALRRVRRHLRRQGLPSIGLAENEFLGTLASLAQVTAGRDQVREEWRFWHSGSVSQATFRLGGWDALSPAIASQLVQRLLTAAPQATVTVSVIATRKAETEPEIEAALRIAAANPPLVDHAARTLTGLAAQWAVRLERLDGRHAHGLAATLPLGVR